MSAQGIRAGRAFIEIGTYLDPLNRGLRKARAQLAAMSTYTSQLGRTMIGSAVAMALPFGHATMIFANFDDRMRSVKAVSQASGEEFARLTHTAKELGRTTSFTASQVAELMIELGRAGFNPEQINQMTAAVLNLSRATGTDAAMSAGIMAASIRQFNLEASDAVRVADGLTAAANKSFNTVESLGEAMKYAGPVAADLGMSIEETLAILGALGNVGIQGSAAGTALRRLGVIGAAEGKQLQKIFGVAFTDAAGAARPLVDVLDEVNTATANLGSAERTAKFAEAFGLLGITAASAISKNAVSAKDLLNEIQAATGIAAATAKEMDAGLGGSFRMLLSAAEGAALAVGEAISVPLQSLNAMVIELLGPMTAWIGANRDLIVLISAMIIGVGVAGAGLIALSATFALLKFSLAPAVALLALMKLGFAVLVSPVALLLGAVALLAYQLVDWQTVSAEVFAWFQTNFGGLVAAVSEGITAIGAALMRGDIEAAAKILWLGVKQIWLSGINPLITMWNDLKFGAVEVFLQIENAAARMWSNIKRAAQVGWADWSTSVKKATEWAIAQGRKMGATDDEKAAIDRELEAVTGGLDIANANDKQQIDQQHQQEMANLDADRASTQAAIESQHQAAVSKLDADLAAAKAEYQKLMEDERKKQQEHAQQKADETKKESAAGTANAMAKMNAGGGAGSGADREALGSFSAFGIWGMGASSAADRTANATENLAKIAIEIERNTGLGAVYGT